MAARVQKEDSDYVMNSNSAYSNDDGELQVKFDMKPGFETAVFKDADLFLPYTAITVPKGKYSLKLDIDLSYEDGTLIKHLQFYEFDFTQP